MCLSLIQLPVSSEEADGPLYTPIPNATTTRLPHEGSYYRKTMDIVVEQYRLWEEQLGEEEAIDMLERWLSHKLENPPISVPDNVSYAMTLVVPASPFAYKDIGVRVMFVNGMARSIVLCEPGPYFHNSAEDMLPPFATPSWIPPNAPYYRETIHIIFEQYHFWEEQLGEEEAVNIIASWLNQELENPPVDVPYNVEEAFVLVEPSSGSSYKATGVQVIFSNDTCRYLHFCGKEAEFLQNVIKNMLTPYPQATATMTPIPTPTATSVWIPPADPYYRESISVVVHQLKVWKDELGIEEAIYLTTRWLNKELDNPPIPIPENIIKAYVLVEEPENNPIGIDIIFANNVARSITVAGKQGEIIQNQIKNMLTPRPEATVTQTPTVMVTLAPTPVADCPGMTTGNQGLERRE